MASETGFFNPDDLIDINTLLDLEGLAQWEIQTGTPSKSKDRAFGLDRYGDENASKEHNPNEKIVLVYECQAEEGFLVIPKAGQIAETYHIDSLKVDYKPNGWPTLTVNAHKHTGTTGTHAADTCRMYSSTLALPAQFGIPAEIKDLLDVSSFKINTTACGLKTLSYGLGVTHVDEFLTEWLAGENRDGTETLDVSFSGIPIDADLTFAAAWHTPTDSSPKSNSAPSSRSISKVKHIKKDAVVPPGP